MLRGSGNAGFLGFRFQVIYGLGFRVLAPAAKQSIKPWKLKLARAKGPDLAETTQVKITPLRAAASPKLDRNKPAKSLKRSSQPQALNPPNWRLVPKVPKASQGLHLLFLLLDGSPWHPLGGGSQLLNDLV